MEYHEPRDYNGNRTPSYISPGEAYTSGAISSDTPDDIAWKVRNHRALQTPAGFHASGSWRVACNFFAICCIVFLLFIALMLTQPWWKLLASPSVMWERLQTSLSVSERRERFSDFSSLQQWPPDIREIVVRRTDSSVPQLLAALPVNGKMSKKERTQLGAALWFAISAQGKHAHEAYALVQKSSVGRRFSGADVHLSFLPMEFLNKRCEAGLDVACLDLAKALASATFRTAHTHTEDQWLSTLALAAIPQGTRGNSRAFVELKARIIAHRAK